jgi:hypothetical protein
MTKPELMKVFEAAVDDAIRTKMWGEITVLFKEGSPAVMREQKTRVLEGATGQNHAAKNILR